ncbi:hypothetical protein KAI54_02380 [Candidatus Gracilibacteria bacterium]|nr:hypothetical protein [Candidatus Gracilibacteria bacterium]
MNYKTPNEVLSEITGGAINTGIYEVLIKEAKTRNLIPNDEIANDALSNFLSFFERARKNGAMFIRKKSMPTKNMLNFF